DGKPETLRLLDAIPPRWLKDAAVISVEKAPSAFGELSLRAESRLKDGEVIVTVQAPPRPVGKWQVRLPNPPGYQITDVAVESQKRTREAAGRVDLTGRNGKFTVRFEVKKQCPTPTAVSFSASPPPLRPGVLSLPRLPRIRPRRSSTASRKPPLRATPSS